MATLARYDVAGYAIPFAADLEVDLAVAAILGDIPASADHDVIDWDAAWDEPTDDDRAWWAEESETDPWIEYEQWLDRLNTLKRLDACGTFTDEDLMAAGLPVG